MGSNGRFQASRDRETPSQAKKKNRWDERAWVAQFNLVSSRIIIVMVIEIVREGPRQEASSADWRDWFRPRPLLLLLLLRGLSGVLDACENYVVSSSVTPWTEAVASSWSEVFVSSIHMYIPFSKRWVSSRQLFLISSSCDRGERFSQWSPMSVPWRTWTNASFFQKENI